MGGKVLKKVCLVASSGGHFEQVLRLKALNKSFTIFYVTERTPYVSSRSDTYYVKQINRKETLAPIFLAQIVLKSFYIFWKEQPDIIISTGALSTIPLLLIGHLFHKKIVYIESFAKITTPTRTGQFVYKFADVFIVQWESLLKYYPNAECLGPIY